MSDEKIGLVFLFVMSVVGVRYLIKTGNNDTSVNKVDFLIAIGVAILIVVMNI